MAKDVLITYKQPVINKDKIPEVYQYCDKCKDGSVHKKDIQNRILVCIKCQHHVKYR